MTTQQHEPGFEETVRNVCLAVRDWGKSLARQEFDDDPTDGMDVSTATAAILAAHEAEADRRVLEARMQELKLAAQQYYAPADDFEGNTLVVPVSYMERRVTELQTKLNNPGDK